MRIDLDTCFNCGSRMTTRREDVPYLGMPGTMLLGVNVSRCPSCGEHEVEIPMLDGETGRGFRDRRFKEAEAKSIAADRAESQGQRDLTMALDIEAAEGFAGAAIDVPADHPNTRSDLAISAVASFARAGRRDLAARFARRMLAQQDALSPRGRGELARAIAEYESLAERDRP